jgi:hypothetical protein
LTIHAFQLWHYNISRNHSVLAKQKPSQNHPETGIQIKPKQNGFYCMKTMTFLPNLTKHLIQHFPLKFNIHFRFLFPIISSLLNMSNARKQRKILEMEIGQTFQKFWRILLCKNSSFWILASHCFNLYRLFRKLKRRRLWNFQFNIQNWWKLNSTFCFRNLHNVYLCHLKCEMNFQGTWFLFYGEGLFGCLVCIEIRLHWCPSETHLSNDLKLFKKMIWKSWF